MQPQQEVIQQPVIALIPQHNVGSSLFHKAARSQMKVFSAFQVVAGMICFGFGIAGIVHQHEYYNYIGYGIWTGLYFILVGSIGIGAANSNTQCFTISAMVLNIIASVLCGISVIFSSFGISWSRDCHEYSSRYYTKDCRQEKAALATNAVLLTVSYVELHLTVWSAFLCCRAVCSCCKPSHHGTVLYQPQTTNQMNFTTNTGGPTVIYPGENPSSAQRHSTSGQLPTGYMLSPQATPMYCFPVQVQAATSTGNSSLEQFSTDTRSA